MADNINTETNNLEQSNNVPDQQSQELAANMALALGLKTPESVQPNAEIVTPHVIENQPAITSPEEAPGIHINPDAPVFSFETLKEKFGYQSPEEVEKDIQEYKKYKENPVAEIEFENEESRKYFEAVKAGKMKEANEIVSKQQEIAAVLSEPLSKENAEKVIKLNWRLKYGLEPDQIDYKYKKQFGIKKEPKAESFVSDEEFEEAHNEWKESVHSAEMDKIIEAKLLQPELENYKQELVLPDIDEEVDPDYLAWKQQQENGTRLNEEVIQAYKSFTPKNIETKINFNDEANKVAFEFQHEPSAEDFSTAVGMVTDINKFYEKFIGQDGKPDREGFLKAIYFALNRDKVITDAINQSKNATIKSRLPVNGQFSQQRQNPNMAEVSELDAQMNLALNGYRKN